ncbi:MAG: hypothetical protein ACR2L2_05680 [Acidobacteriota bacterium]
MPYAVCRRPDVGRRRAPRHTAYGIRLRLAAVCFFLPNLLSSIVYA